MEGIEYPVCFSDIPKFVKQNNISVQVIGYEKETYFPAFQNWKNMSVYSCLKKMVRVIIA